MAKDVVEKRIILESYGIPNYPVHRHNTHRNTSIRTKKKVMKELHRTKPDITSGTSDLLYKAAELMVHNVSKAKQRNAEVISDLENRLRDPEGISIAQCRKLKTDMLAASEMLNLHMEELIKVRNIMTSKNISLQGVRKEYTANCHLDDVNTVSNQYLKLRSMAETLKSIQYSKLRSIAETMNSIKAKGKGKKSGLIR